MSFFFHPKTSVFGINIFENLKFHEEIKTNIIVGNHNFLLYLWSILVVSTKSINSVSQVQYKLVHYLSEALEFGTKVRKEIKVVFGLALESVSHLEK